MLGGLATLADGRPLSLDPGRRSHDRNDADELRKQRIVFPGQSQPQRTDLSKQKRPQAWLLAALAELRECPGEAEQEGYPKPTPTALDAAEAILRRVAMLSFALPEPSVYPSADHEIVIYFRRQEARVALSVSIDADGSGAWFTNVGGRRRMRYESVRNLPDEHLKTELREFAHLAQSG